MTENTDFLDQKHSMLIEEISSDKVHPLNSTEKCVQQCLFPPSPIKGKIILNHKKDSYGNNFINHSIYQRCLGVV